MGIILILLIDSHLFPTRVRAVLSLGVSFETIRLSIETANGIKTMEVKLVAKKK